MGTVAADYEPLSEGLRLESPAIENRAREHPGIVRVEEMRPSALRAR